MAKHRSGRYIEGAINRQKVLDYLNANPGHNAVQIEQALKLGTNLSTLLRRMTEMNELARVPVIYTAPNVLGVIQAQRTFAYTALVKATRNADAVREIITTNVNGNKPKKRPKWVTSNTEPDRPVTPNPDAMRGVGYRGMTQLEAMV